MATFTWEVYSNTPDWNDVGSNTIVFCGSASDLTTPITVGEWQLGTHVGSGDPGTDQCGGSTHANNVMYVSDTQCNINAGGTQDLNQTNLAETECTLRIKFEDASSVSTSAARFYSFNSTTVTEEAEGIEAYAVERTSSFSSWSLINDDSEGTGGDVAGQRLSLADQGASQTHYFYVAVSARPESVGAKTNFDFGVALTYS